MDEKDISVIIPCTRLELARAAIHSLLPQLKPFDHEIIVVGKDKQAIKDDFKDDNVMVVNTPDVPSPSRARNLGAIEARGKVLIFVDDDCEALPGLVENYMEKLSDAKVGVVTPKIIGKSNKFFAQCLDYGNFYSQIGDQEKALTSIKCSSAIRRELFAKVGGLDEKIVVQEDVDLARRIGDLGLEVRYFPRAVLHHNHGRDSFRKLMRYNFNYGQLSGLNVAIKHKEGFKDKVKVLAKKFYIISFLPFSLWSTYIAVKELAGLSKGALIYTPFIFLSNLSYQVGVLKWSITQRRSKMKKTNWISAFLKWLKVITKKHETPPFLIFSVTSTCDLRCHHCFYWQKIDGHTKDLDMPRIKRLTEELGPVYGLLITGGEPYLRKDLPEILELFCKNNGTKRISLPTNGHVPDLVHRKTKEILSKIGDTLLEVQLSIDGLQEAHNEMRAVNDSFQKLMETYEIFKELKKDAKNLKLNVAITVNTKNIDELPELRNHIRNNMKAVDSVYWGFFRGETRKNNIFLPDGKTLGGLHELNNSFRTGFVPSFLNDLFFRIKIKTLQKGTQVVGCAAGELIGVIDNDGDVRACELLKSVGNIKDKSFKAVWHSPEAKKMKQSIKNKECHCTHECFLAPSVIYSPMNCFKIIPEIFSSLKDTCFGLKKQRTERIEQRETVSV